MTERYKIKLAVDSDAPELINLIGSCFAEYEGCVLDLDGIDKPMQAMRSYVDEYKGDFWLAIRDGEVVGSAGYLVLDDHVELIKLYVKSSERRQGLASLLLGLVEDASNTKGLRLELWSDTRFIEAHAFYAHHGYVKQTDTRFLNDPSNTTEFHFIKQL